MKNRAIILLCLLVAACGSVSSQKTTKTVQPFTLPEIPTILTTPEQRAEFVMTHYWQNFDFTDTTLISRADYTEQAFADFANLLPNVPAELAERGVDKMMSQARIDSSMFAKFVSLSEKYFYDPNSPFRNEGAYIMVLRSVIANDKIDEIEKIRPQYQLDLALKNRVGKPATDFEYTTDSGKKARLYSAKGEYVIVFFFHPECPTCKQVKEYVAKNNIEKLVPIVWVNNEIDEHLEKIYDLRASPTLYLLDKDKNVVLKDAPIKVIEEYITSVR